MINAISLFSGSGIDEFFLKDVGVNVVLANEIIKSRAESYKQLHPASEMLCADICEDETKDYIVKKAVESILAQSYSNFELFLVDDGSTDDSGLICDEFAKKDERVNVIHQQI